MPELNADCYLLSMGTNESQDQNLTADFFLNNVNITVQKLRETAPNTAIIISSPPVSYYKKSRPNPILIIITNALKEYCQQNKIVFWDLHTISKGKSGIKIWKNKKLLRPDLVHFSNDGYILQGNLFINAFAQSWNSFLISK